MSGMWIGSKPAMAGSLNAPVTSKIARSRNAVKPAARMLTAIDTTIGSPPRLRLNSAKTSPIAMPATIAASAPT